MKATLIDVIEVSNTLGEGVTYDGRTGMLWWTDIQERKLYRLYYNDRELQIYNLPERLGSFGLTEDPATLVCAFETGFYLYQPAHDKMTLITRIETDTPDTRLNDGRLDPQGRFWAGSMVEQQGKTEATGALYSLSKGSVQKHLSGIGISNGLAWSADGSVMYFTDTLTGKVQQFPYDPTKGEMGIAKPFITTAKGYWPDGAVVDNDNHYWSAQWGRGAVARYSPEGEEVYRINCDAPHVTCAEFGGNCMSTLFVTSATEGLNDKQLAKHPNSGHLFIFETDVRGIARNTFYPLY